MSETKPTILFFAANPASTMPLALDEELRSIEQVLRASELRDAFTLTSKWATRTDDLLQYLNELRPTIVHLSGHGSSNGELMLHDEGRAMLVSPLALAQLFGLQHETIKLVFVNACNSQYQAEAIAEHIDCVIGSSGEADDVAARIFARSFYRALGFGESVAQAHEQGRAALLLEGIPEEQSPKLVVRPGVDAAQVFPLKAADDPVGDWAAWLRARPVGGIAAAGMVLVLLVTWRIWAVDREPETDSVEPTADANSPSEALISRHPNPETPEQRKPEKARSHEWSQESRGYCSNPGGCVLAWDGPAIQAIATGGNHFCVIPTDGSLSCWGSNDSGQLGYGHVHRRCVNCEAAAEVVRVDVGSYVRNVAVGNGHTCVVIAEGDRVRCWGLNGDAQLGLGHRNDVGDEPGEMPPPNVHVGAPANQIAAGAHHTCALVEGGKIRCWGAGQDGELCDGQGRSRGGSEDDMPPPDIQGISSATQIVAGDGHTCALLADGTVRCWGQSRCGQVGVPVRFGMESNELVPPEVDVGGKVVQLAAGREFTCARMDDGAVRCWGCNQQGQLGYGHTEGLGDQPGELPPPDVDFGGRATQVVAGFNHVCVLLDTKKVRCWGGGESGELGLGEREPLGDAPGEMPPPDMQIGDVKLLAAHMGNFTCALLVDGTVRCWGGIS